MDWHETKASILRRLFMNLAERLGEGEEAEVYALGPERVVRFFKQPVNRAYVDNLRAFYASLDLTQVGFAVPFVIEQNSEDGICYAIERRILGSSLADALLLLEGTARRRALQSYAETCIAISKLGCPRESFGEVLATPALRAPTRAAFALDRAEASLTVSRDRFAGHLDRPDRALTRLGSMLTQLPTVQPQLVHGDYYPANVMIGQDGRITGVIDFGPLTLIGDARMDAASAVLYLTGMAGITAQDRQVVLSCLQSHGLRDVDLALYRLFYAFRFLDTSRKGLLRWCVETIRAAC